MYKQYNAIHNDVELDKTRPKNQTKRTQCNTWKN